MERDSGKRKKRFWRKKKLPEEQQVVGEQPEGAADGVVPGVIFVDGRVSLKGLKERAADLLEKKPEIMKGAKKKRQEVVAFVNAHGTGILIGTGVILAAGIGAVVFRRTRQRKK